jgi:regulation of enolase protein 1 (concanavalin A-like superfamily)
VSAAGADIWGTADAFRYTYRPLSADGVIVARVASMSGTEPWMKAGVMIRASTAPGAPHAAMFVSLSKGLAFQRRSVEGGLSMHTAGPALPAPYWLKLERSGHIFTASVSSDGVAWSVVGGADIPMPGTVLVGLAVTSHTSAALATAVLDSVKVTTSSVGSSGWRSDDVGAVGVAGSASDAAGTFTVRGAGADVWGTVDAFHYLSRTLSGDGAVVARVQGVEGTHAWTKVGVMMRAGLDAASPHGFMLVSAAKGLAFQRRTVPGGVTAHTAATSATARWVKLTRTGNVIIASVSADGVVWTEVGRDTFAFNGAPIRVGLAVTSHDAAQLATGIFDNVWLTLAP